MEPKRELPICSDVRDEFSAYVGVTLHPDVTKTTAVTLIKLP